LNTAPVEKSRSLSDQQQRKTRKEELEEAGQEPDVPDVAAPFIISYLLDIGPVIAAGFGPAAIHWRDILAWQQCTSVRLPPWQARLIIELSKEYLVFSEKAKEPDCLSPLSNEAKQGYRREAISKSLRIGFKAMMISVGPKPKKKAR
jgi:hypothetical protein